ncbi:MAG TPA: hypothetical protein PKU87_06105 [Candidatus Atribacteria bacterium]|nr:hypothetical protein [Candidatus Atribacteria bacterium]
MTILNIFLIYLLARLRGAYLLWGRKEETPVSIEILGNPVVVERPMPFLCILIVVIN